MSVKPKHDTVALNTFRMCGRQLCILIIYYGVAAAAEGLRPPAVLVTGR